MDETIYFQRYRVSTDEQGRPEQVSRSGAAINYKAVDLQSGEPVMLQLVPLASIDPSKRERFEQRAEAVQKLDHVNIPRVRDARVEDERFVFVSEYVEGETADSWVIAHGPLSPDAVLRVALQVVRAIAAAAFHGLTHRAIQPANLMIVPGVAPEGGWPFVKLLNFGVAGIELHSESGEAREVAPSLPPQFASPEQLRGGEIDFGSEMYSLGATMCFLLAGAVPLAVGMSVRARLRSLPELRRAPRRLRKLLARMLHETRHMRPQDPVAFEKEIQKCLGKTRPRQAIVRSLTPVAPVLPTQPVEGPTPLSQVWRGAIAFAALVLLGAIAAAFFFPNIAPWRHRRDDIGKQVGVPERSTSSLAQPDNVAPAATNQPVPAGSAMAAVGQTGTENAQAPQPNAPANTTTTIAQTLAQQNSSANAQPAQTSAAAVPPAPANSTSPITQASGASSEPVQSMGAAPPAEGPRDQANSQQGATAAETKTSGPPPTEKSPGAIASRSDQSKKKTRVAESNRKSSKRTTTLEPALAAEEAEAIRRAGQVRANFVGTTEDGRVLLRLPSGEIVSVTPRGEDEHFPERRLHRRAIEREEYPRAEPVSPDDEPRD